MKPQRCSVYLFCTLSRLDPFYACAGVGLPHVADGGHLTAALQAAKTLSSAPPMISSPSLAPSTEHVSAGEASSSAAGSQIGAVPTAAISGSSRDFSMTLMDPESESCMLLAPLGKELLQQDARHLGQYNRLMSEVVGGVGEACLLPPRSEVEAMDVKAWLDFLDARYGHAWTLKVRWYVMLSCKDCISQHTHSHTQYSR